MNKYYFQLTNLTNDKEICMLPKITSKDIELAIDLHCIEINDIRIEILERY